MVRDLARRFLAENLGVDTLHALVAGNATAADAARTPPLAWDRDLWDRIVELGWTGLCIPENAGGVGMGRIALAALVEETGRAALPAPLMATLFATQVLLEAPGEAAHASLEEIARGRTAALAITNSRGSWDPAESDVRGHAAGLGTTLGGTASFVQGARKADFLVVSARTDDGIGLYRVAANAPGVAVHPDHILDLTRDQARVSFDHVEVDAAQCIAAPGDGASVLAHAWPALLTLVAADLCGAAEWQLQTTAEYARVRTQFERPIGFFQAVKHPIVNMMIEVDRARSLVYAAAEAIDSKSDDALRLARMAKAAASDAASFCSGRSVQLHGGIGFTWDSPVHIYFKRQKHGQFLFGDGIAQRAALASQMAA